MTSKLEEAAAAHLLRLEGLDWDYVSPLSRKLEVEAMRAALQVLREPGDDPIDQATVLAGGKSWHAILLAWQAGIDAILQEGE